MKIEKKVITKGVRALGCIWLLGVSVSLLVLNIFSKMGRKGEVVSPPLFAFHRYLRQDWILNDCPIIQTIYGNFGTTKPGEMI